MDIAYKFGRFWVLLLPVALLVMFFKYLHQLSSMLTSIEGVGLGKTSLILFIAFFAIWSLAYLGSMIFVRAARWVWRGTTLTSIEKPSAKTQKELERPLKNNIEGQGIKERDDLFRLDLQGESAA